jgi:hypothetical protein
MAFFLILFFALKSRDLSVSVTPLHPRKGATLTEIKNIQGAYSTQNLP